MPSSHTRSPAAGGEPRGSARILVTTGTPEEQTAWTKARKDVMRISTQSGYQPVALPSSTRLDAWIEVWHSLAMRLQRGGQLLLEYPLDSRRRLLPLWLLCRWRRARMVALIHDLDSLRSGSSQQRELSFLRLFDGLITHNPAMTAWLRARGLGADIVDLGMFDYCRPPVPDDARAWHEPAMSSPLKVVCAGNLAYRKAAYLYDPRWGEVQDVKLSLFGAFFEPERMAGSAICHKGAFDPDAPSLDDTYHFGLVWDGDSVDGCQGRYGEYLRINSPHKLSLYAAVGLPVVVWKHAAIADFVQAHGIGVAIGDLRELGDFPQRITSEAYRHMASNMRVVGRAAGQGRFLRQALRRLDASQ